ncbi:V-type proton ATPase subunit H isoform X2 [Galendromus occidentalis]|uniref:V-type proton ATPase subunit H n=1 Tax=Galendromus occidentalis TaxID=34638 RepID=A0AAJ7PA03_9ACAR|nr:V-type proton ATPase subunit H isoform X2 [Galendromus occidentalis]
MSTRQPSFDQMLSSMPRDIEKGVVTANSLLHQKAHEIKQQGVNWTTYEQLHFINPEDFQFIKNYEAAGTPEKRTALLADEQNGQQCAKTLCVLLANVSKDQTVQYLLILIDDMFEEDIKRVEIFREWTRKRKESVFAPFLNLLQRPDRFIVNMAARIVAKIAYNSKPRMEEPELTKYLSWLKEQLKLPNNEYVQSAARCLQMMLRIDEYREPFSQIEGVQVIVEVLRTGNMNFQMQYQCTFCLWVLAFNPGLCARMSRLNIVPVLSDILTQSQKEKVTRIVLATLRNFLEKPQEPSIVRENSIAMIQCKVLKNLVNLQQNPREDPDVVDDIDYLVEKLQILEQDMSSYDEYMNEVKTGRLEWSPVHSSEKFWRENSEKLNERNYELLKMLISLLESDDSLIVTVAAHDLGEYVRHYPRGKQVIEKLNGKHRVMQLLSHSDPNVRYEALLCVQKLIVHKWEYLGRQMQSEQPAKKTPAVRAN